MNRREFLKNLLIVPTGIVLVKNAVISEALASDDLKSFAYYQGLGPTEKRSPSRTDGTYSSMPLILRVDIDAAVEKKYKFWHGHSGSTHSFTLTEDDFLALQDGDTIETYTSVVTGHRHALRIVGT